MFDATPWDVWRIPLVMGIQHITLKVISTMLGHWDTCGAG
jgi:hypothetical protein